jgi:hypothetical protein
MPDEAPDLSLLARQQRQILTELGSMRDDRAVLTAIAMRQDGTLTALLGEIRSMHSQHTGWLIASATWRRNRNLRRQKALRGLGLRCREFVALADELSVAKFAWTIPTVPNIDSRAIPTPVMPGLDPGTRCISVSGY